MTERSRVLRFHIDVDENEELKRQASLLATTKTKLARLYIQEKLSYPPIEQEIDPNFRLNNLRTLLPFWGFVLDSDKGVVWYVAKYLRWDLFVHEDEINNNVWLDSSVGTKDLIPNYHSFSVILRRRLVLLLQN